MFQQILTVGSGRWSPHGKHQHPPVPSEGAVSPLLSLHKTRAKVRITKNDFDTLIDGNHASISSHNDHIGRHEALEVAGDPLVVSIGTLPLPCFALLRRVKIQTEKLRRAALFRQPHFSGPGSPPSRRH